MKKSIIKIIISGFVISPLASPGFGTEAFTIKYGESVPVALDMNEILIFERGPKGEISIAETETIQKRKLEQSKPAFKSGDIKCIRKTAIPALPGRTLWTYQISGLGSFPTERTVRLSFEGNPPELMLALPSSCVVKGDLQVDRFTLEKVKDIPDASTICEVVSCTKSNVFFEKIIPAGSNSVVISVVATSKESSPLVRLKAEVDGYKAITVLMPGPDIGV
jgi:hypothetical protein